MINERKWQLYDRLLPLIKQESAAFTAWMATTDKSMDEFNAAYNAYRVMKGFLDALYRQYFSA